MHCRSRSASGWTTRRRRRPSGPFATGFFRDVRIENDNGALVVVVQERPTISRVEFIGNKGFDTDTLKKALRDIACPRRALHRAALDRARR